MIERSLRLGDIDVHCITSEHWDELSLILLHGASFSSDIWARTGTLQMLDGTGISYAAPDLPGFGRTQKSRQYARYQGMNSFVADLAEAMGAKRLLLAGASMGGGVALAFAKERPHMIEGLFLIGSVGLNWPGIPDFLRLLGKPVELVWGRRDTVVPVDVARQLASSVPNVALTVLDGEHPVYLQDTERFNASMKAWVNKIATIQNKGSGM